MKVKDLIINFLIPEFKLIIGRFGQKIFLLVFLLFVSLVALGIANGSLQYLKLKMDDVFVKFVDIDIAAFVKQGQKELNKRDIEKDIEDNNWEYVEKKIIEGRQKSIRFYNNNIELDRSGLILETNDEFYAKVTDTTNNNEKVLLTRNTFHDKSWGIIITEKLQKDLKLDQNQAYIGIWSQNNQFVIPICGVVKQLRRKQQFIFSKKLYTLLTKQKNKVKELYNDSLQGTIKYFITKSKNDSIIEKKLNDLNYKKSFISSSSSVSHVKGDIYESSILKPLKKEKIVVGKDTIKLLRIRDLDALTIPQQTNLSSIKPEFYTVLFNDLQKVNIFDKYLKEKYKVELDKTVVENKKNLTFFESLSEMLSIAIIIFSFLSIVFFILNLMISHINKNKKNIGTLKAFGLTNSNIVIIYSSITFSLVIISFAISYLLSLFLGNNFLELYINLNSIDSMNYISNVEFSSYNFISLFISFIVFPTLIIFAVLTKLLYKVTPGDLIYERK